MNLNKLNLYKNALYCLIASAVITLVGVIMLIVLGFNLDASINSINLFFTSVISTVLSLLAIFIYVGFRHSFSKALSIVLVNVHNIILSTALICIIRIPVSSSIIMGYILLIGLTTVFSLILTEKLDDVNLKKSNYNEIIKNSIKSNIKALVIVFAVLLAILLLGLIISSVSMFNLVREFSVMLIVIIYGALTINLPIWCFFSSKIKKVKRVQVDKNISNQKVAKAVPVSNPETDNLATESENSEMASNN